MVDEEVKDGDAGGETAKAAAAAEAAKESRNQVKDAYIVQLTELLFVVVPIVIFSLVFWRKGKFHDVWEIPEWSFAAMILCGQTLVKFISGVMENSVAFRAPRIVFFVAILIVLGFFSATVLLLVLTEKITSGPADNPISKGLMIAQFVVFGIALLCFFLMGASAELNRIRKGKV